MGQKLALTKDLRVAAGSQREVYLHPTDPTKLIKVLRDIPLTKGRARLATFTEKHFPSTKWKH